jgi:riboflavin kinase/FMN adenylyltransferase
MAEMSAEDFIQNIIIDSFEARAVCIGHDFHFGKNRAGTPDMLKTAWR